MPPKPNESGYAVVNGVELYYARRGRNAALGRGGGCGGIAVNVAAFVASDQARTMTATAVNISCGAIVD